MITRLVFLSVLALLTAGVTPQESPKKILTLEEVIGLAQEQSLPAILARHSFRGSYWQYRMHVANYLPKLSLDGQLIDFNRSLKKYQLQDGSYTYVEDNANAITMGMNLRQNIGFTGGSVFASSDLQRVDQFGENESFMYLSSPILLGFSQPLSGYNEFRWEKKIEPLRYEEAKKKYIDAMEGVAMRAVRFFFDLALAQLNVEIARINYQNTDTLYKIAQGRFNMGTIAENELLQLELTHLNAGTDLNNAGIELEIYKFQLRSLLNLSPATNVELIVPSGVPFMEVDINKALTEAKQNNPDMIQLERELIEAQRDVAMTKAEKGLNAELFASFGLTQTAVDIPGAYKKPQDQQTLRVGIELPILDWGLGRGRYKMARSNQEVINTNVQQSKIDFEQQVLLKVMQYNLQDDQLLIAAKADTVAQYSYEISKQRFLIGKIDVIDLNDALEKKDIARRGYISALRGFWTYYFEIRQLTQYDFLRQQPLGADFEAMIE
ncbi:MAG: TolC family protein [Bacteroidales bacterium]|nr:TolC family protein [Bacteroidales bacterium]MBN2761534.1 TolC family protein [Bacteroidales bacterium]